MKLNKKKWNICPDEQGFSLLETLVAIVVFSLVITGIGSSLVMAHRINSRSEVLMQEQLKVRRAVEGIMASGIDTTVPELGLDAYYDDLYPEVYVSVNRGSLQKEGGPVQAAFYVVIVQSKVLSEQVSVTTYVRPMNTHEVSGEGESS